MFYAFLTSVTSSTQNSPSDFWQQKFDPLMRILFLPTWKRFNFFFQNLHIKNFLSHSIKRLVLGRLFRGYRHLGVKGPDYAHNLVLGPYYVHNPVLGPNYVHNLVRNQIMQ